jgi:hypothetical protein
VIGWQMVVKGMAMFRLFKDRGLLHGKRTKRSFGAGALLGVVATLYSLPSAALEDCGPVVRVTNRALFEGSRPCNLPIIRNYKRKYNSIGHTILDLESEACFVPDSSYQLLDSIIDQVKAKMGTKTSEGFSEKYVQQISQTTSGVMKDNGFQLLINTYLLSDAWLPRSEDKDSKIYIFDCDTGSFILLSVADVLKAPAHLVEIKLNERSAHNYVQWQLRARP